MTNVEYEKIVEQIVNQFYDDMRNDIKNNKATEALMLMSIVLLSLTLPIILENKEIDLKKQADYVLDRLDKIATITLPSDPSSIHRKSIQYLQMLMMDVKANEKTLNTTLFN